MPNFELIVRLTLERTGNPVVFKVDGQRFNTSHRTIKLHANENYIIDIETIPAQQLRDCSISNNPMPLQSKEKPGCYTTVWSSDVQVSKKGVREDLAFSIQTHEGVFQTKLQCKFYKSDCSSADWGEKLNSICFKCASHDGVIRATDEQFR